MLELILSACLLGKPAHCKDVHLVYSSENLTPMQCLMGAQAEVAKWVESHPKWTAKRWSCRPAGQIANM